MWILRVFQYWLQIQVCIFFRPRCVAQMAPTWTPSTIEDKSAWLPTPACLCLWHSQPRWYCEVSSSPVKSLQTSYNNQLTVRSPNQYLMILENLTQKIAQDWFWHWVVLPGWRAVFFIQSFLYWVLTHSTDQSWHKKYNWRLLGMTCNVKSCSSFTPWNVFSPGKCF